MWDRLRGKRKEGNEREKKERVSLRKGESCLEGGRTDKAEVK